MPCSSVVFEHRYEKMVTDDTTSTKTKKFGESFVALCAVSAVGRQMLPKTASVCSGRGCNSKHFPVGQAPALSPRRSSHASAKILRIDSFTTTYHGRQRVRGSSPRPYSPPTTTPKQTTAVLTVIDAVAVRVSTHVFRPGQSLRHTYCRSPSRFASLITPEYRCTFNSQHFAVKTHVVPPHSAPPLFLRPFSLQTTKLLTTPSRNQSAAKFRHCPQF